MCCKDIAGRMVEVGDTVAFVEVGYRSLSVGEVTKITPKGVWVRKDGGRESQRLWYQIALVEK